MGGSVTLGGESRRRRVSPEESFGYATFVLDAADLTDRPFMEVAWLEPNADSNTQIAMTDSAGNSFLKYDYPAGEDDMGTTWRTTLSLAGVAAGEVNLTIQGGDGHQFYPFITLFKLNGVSTSMGSLSCVVPTPAPTPAPTPVPTPEETTTPLDVDGAPRTKFVVLPLMFMPLFAFGA